MIRYLELDFECRAVRSPKDHTSYKYTLCPEFKVLCVCYKFLDQDYVRSVLPPEFSDKAGASPTQHKISFWDLADYAKDFRIIFVAHNVQFEFDVWHNYLVPKYGFPPIPISRWRCTAAAAAAKALPRELGRLGKALDTKFKKSDEGHRNMLAMCKPIPATYTKHRQLYGDWYELDKDFEELLKYCKTDVLSESSALEKIGFLPDALQEEWELDHKINQRGIRIDMPLCHAILKMKEEIKSELNADMEVVIGCRASQIEKIKDWVEERGVDLPKVKKKSKKTGEMKETRVMDGAVIKGLLVHPNTPQMVKVVLNIRRDFATTSLAKVDKALQQQVEGIIREQFMFHGATTGRAAGKGVQFHNLPRGDLNENIVDADMSMLVEAIKWGNIADMLDLFPGLRAMQCLKSSLRGIVIARAGKKLQVMDFSQIESRVLAWLAGQDDKIQVFLDGKDPYRHNAALILNKDYDAVTKNERSTVGKVSELALGFQGGGGAFKKMAINYGLHYTTEEADDIKTTWRYKNGKIVQFWYDLEAAAMRAVQTGKAISVGKIKFKIVGMWLAIRLPSGRKLWYYDPKVRKYKTSWGAMKWGVSFMGTDYQKGIPWGRITTYGGRWCENITQAVARDLLYYAMGRADKAGMDIILHVHDEIGIEVDPGEYRLQYLKKIMSNMPEWAEGLPVEADGFQSDRYRK